MSKSYASLTARAALCFVLLLAVAPMVFAMGPGGVRKQVEASMLVTGTVQIDTAGKVVGHSLDEQEKLPPGVVAVIDKAVPGWTFEPVQIDGHAANVSARMSVRVIAKRTEGDNYFVTLRSASFGDAAEKFPQRKSAPRNDGNKNAEKVCKTGLTPPAYPMQAAQHGVASNVYLLLKVGQDGKVLDAIAEQVNLKVVTDEANMKRWRGVFANTALHQAAQWCLEPPTDPEVAQAGFFVARVPVLFTFEDTKYGHWEAYVPGPRQANPWDKKDEGPSFSPDTLAPGTAYAVGSGLKLLTDLSGS